MRKRKKYYFISTVQYTETGSLYRKNNYFYTTFRDFRKELHEIITRRFNSEYIRNACILTKTSSLYVRAHEALSEAYADGYTSANLFFEYGDVDNAPYKL